MKKFLLKIIEKYMVKVNEIERIGKIAEDKKANILLNIEDYKMKHDLKYDGINIKKEVI